MWHHWSSHSPWNSYFFSALSWLSPFSPLTTTCSVLFADSQVLCLWWPLYVATFWGSVVLADSVNDAPDSPCGFNIYSQRPVPASVWQTADPGYGSSLSLSALRPGRPWEFTSWESATSHADRCRSTHSISLVPNQDISQVGPTRSPWFEARSPSVDLCLRLHSFLHLLPFPKALSSFPSCLPIKSSLH